jgi:Zn-dependent protease
MNDVAGIFFQVWLFFIPFLLALCVHEYAHGYVANKLGDPTAKLMGRLTLNPMAHADPFGTVLLPMLAIFFHAPFFGWAKPVPVNGRNLRNQKTGMFWVALAGPGSNVLMAILGALFQAASKRTLPPSSWELIDGFTEVFIQINLALAIFNLIPIHPLDGGKIFAIFFSDRVNRKLEELQPVFNILLIVLFLSGGLAAVLYTPVIAGKDMLLRLSYGLFGLSNLGYIQ